MILMRAYHVLGTLLKCVGFFSYYSINCTTALGNRQYHHSHFIENQSLGKLRAWSPSSEPGSLTLEKLMILVTCDRISFALFSFFPVVFSLGYSMAILRLLISQVNTQEIQLLLKYLSSNCQRSFFLKIAGLYFMVILSSSFIQRMNH